ncbi:MAG: energy transducer TonB [Ferruginibacter sp.]
METNTILQADVLDIIFDKRNKNYGAYELRKHYSGRMYKALGIAALLIIAAFSFTFIKGKKEKTMIPTREITIANIRVAHDKILEPVKPEKPREAVVKQKVNTQQFTNNIKIEKVEAQVPKIEEITEKTVIGSLTEKGAAPGTTALVKGGDAGGETKTGTPEIKPVDNTTPMNTAEVMPSYPGGMDALRKFLQKNLRNPEDLDEGQVVSVKIKFVVGYDGALKSFVTVEDGGAVFNNEVVRVLKKMPAWIPGKTHGENVSVYYTIPVKFVAE